MDEATKKKLLAEHGELVFAPIGGIEFAFKCPSQTDYEEYQGQLQVNKARAVTLSRELCIKTVVEPSVEDLDAALRRRPAAVIPISNALSDLAGAEIEVTTKKG